MSEKKPKNIVFIIGVFEGHISGIVEIVRDLVSLGHKITCYVVDTFAERFKKTGASLKIYSIDKSDIHIPPGYPPIAFCLFYMKKAYAGILSEAIKDEEKKDFLVVDRFFDGRELNKIFKAETVIITYTCILTSYKSEYHKKYAKIRTEFFEPINKRFNLKIRDYLDLPFLADAKYKLVLSSKLFNFEHKSLADDSFFYIGPSMENRAIDTQFDFKKDEKKKLIYISLGTVFNLNMEFYKKCIKAFGDLKEYQVLMSIGKTQNVKDLGDLPDNFHVYNYVPQVQVLEYTDIFISHGGTNSVYEALFKNLLLIIIPQAGDQFGVADCVENHGAGLVLRGNNITPEILVNSVKQIMENKEKYLKGVKKIVESFNEARNERTNVYKKLFC